MMCLSPHSYLPVNASVAIEESNHQTRNALTPGLSSVELLEDGWDRMTNEQRQKHLSKIKNSINAAIEILENNNNNLDKGEVLLFRRKA
jgi:uncharacterized protein YukE